MAEYSFVPITPGNGGYKIRSVKVTIAGVEEYIQALALLDGDGEMLLGRKPAEASLPAALSEADLAAIIALQGGQGWVALPAASEAVLSPPARGVLVYGPGTLVLEAADGSVNAPITLASVPVPFLLNVSVRRRGAGNTAAVIGVR